MSIATGEHTPAPWVVDLDELRESGAAYIYAGDDDTAVARVVGVPADGLLIAAAPRLLAACRFALGAIDRLQEGWGKEGVTETIVGDLREAIAEATKP